MNRERFAWIVSVGLIAVLAFQLPGSLAQRDDDYSFVRTLVEIHRQVAMNYVDPVDENKLRDGAIEGMLSQLDPFTVYVPPAQQEGFDRMLEGSFKGVGIQLNQTEDGKVEVVSPIDGSPAFKAGVQAGDIILKVNGESLEGIRLPDVIKKVAGPLGSEVKLVVRHVTGQEVELKMTREEIVVPTVKGFARKQDNTWDYYVCENPKIAYIRIVQFTPDTYEKLRPAIEGVLADGMKGLILDLRFNPGGRLDQAVDILNMLVEKGTILSTKGRNRPEHVEMAKGENTLPNFPMVVLVNEHSASASEIVAGSLMDNHRAVVVGERTYGKGSVQEVIPLDNKAGELKMTVAYYYLPSGRLVHRKKDATDWGVQPQILVKMTPEQEEQVLKDRYEQELFKKPVVKATTHATATAPASQPTDVQLQAAVNTLIAWVVFDAERGTKGANHSVAANVSPAPNNSVQPTSEPVKVEAPKEIPKSSPVTKPAGSSTEPQTEPESTPKVSPKTAPAEVAPTQPASQKSK
jgi:carboxyl-terminal processing protease